MQSVSGQRALRVVVAAVLCSSAAGCMTAKIEEMREAPTQITSDEAIVLLAKPHLEGTGTEDKFLDCLERELVGESVSADVADRQRAGKTVRAAQQPEERAVPDLRGPSISSMRCIRGSSRARRPPTRRASARSSRVPA